MYAPNPLSGEIPVNQPAPRKLVADGVLQVAWRHRILVAVVTAFAFVSAIVYIRRTPPDYYAVGALYVDHAVTSSVKGTDPGMSDQYLATQCMVMKSAPMLSAVLNEPQIRDLDTFKSSSDPLAELQRYLSVESERKEEVVSVTFEGHNAEEAATVVNTVIDVYCRDQDERLKASAGGALQTLQAARDQCDTERVARQKALFDFKLANPQLSLDSGRGTNVINDRLVALSDARTAAELETARAKAAYDEIHTAPLEQRWIAAKERQDFIEKSYEDQAAQAVALNATKTKLEELEADFKRAEDSWASVDQQAKQFELAGAMPSDKLIVLERARVPAAPFWPDPMRIISVAIVAGLISGTVLALLIELWFKGRLKYVDDVAETLGMPIIGTLPEFGVAMGISMRFGRFIGRGRQLEFHSHSAAAEAVRQVRTAITFTPGSDERRILLVTSPTPGDGKSMLASNLAIAMAKSGKRVLLIDADLRQPVLHKIFALGDRAGLADVLASRSRLADVIYRSNIDGLSILPCGTPPANPAELLEHKAFGTLLERTAEHFDHVLVDSPPVVCAADARIIATKCHATLLVVRCDKSTRQNSELARDGLLSVGARMLGVVVNGVRRDDRKYGQYGNYGYMPSGASTQVEATSVPAIAVVKD